MVADEPAADAQAVTADKIGAAGPRAPRKRCCNWRGGSAIASSARSVREIVHRKHASRRPLFVGNVARLFIDRSNEMWNFQLDRPLYPLSLLMRKVTQ